MADWNGIEFVEYVGNASPGASPQEEFTIDGDRSTKTFDIRWIDRSRAVRAWLGSSTTVTDTTLGFPVRYLSRVTPHYHADFFRISDSKHFLFATQCSFQGVGVDTANPAGVPRMKSSQDTARYELARMKVQYTALPYEVLTDAEMIAAGYVSAHGKPDESTWRRYVSFFPRPAGKFLGLVGSTFKFVSDQKALPQPPGRVIPEWDLRVVWHQVPDTSVPSVLVNPTLKAANTLGAIDTTTGKVNLYDFNGFPAGTLLCLAPEMTPRRSSRGDRIYDVTFHFQFFPLYHNKVPRVVDGVFDFVKCSADGGNHGVVTATAGKLIHDAVDFVPLFRAP